MTYNFALVFGPELHQQLLGFAERFVATNDYEVGYTADSIPHASLIKYEADANPFTTITSQHFEVILSGLTLLPSRASEDGGMWVEVAVLIPDQLRTLVGQLVSGLDPQRIKSEVGDELRPHITICKLKSWKHATLIDLDPALFRSAHIGAELVVGTSGSGFSFEPV